MSDKKYLECNRLAGVNECEDRVFLKYALVQPSSPSLP